MSQSTVVKTVGGVTSKTSKISTVTKTTQHMTSSSQHMQQQRQIEQKVTAKPPQKTENEGSHHSLAKSSVDVSQTKYQNSKQQQSVSAPKPQQSHAEDVCVRCNRTVYKMEEVIAEQQVWHKSCFRCKECNKPLNRYSKVDSFQIHEGVVYCKFHFKQLFGPTTVDDATKRKRELIIRENQPAELPDGVVRSSTGHDLGLDDIQTSDVKTRFQMFEKISTKKEAPEELQHKVGVKRSATVLSKMKKFHSIENYDNDNDSIHSDDYGENDDVDLIRAKRAQRERPLVIDNMNEIKNKFEAGIEQDRQVRHQERKMEIQNIRSRLFHGKQARTKEMYESAVAELDTNPKLRNKGLTTAYELDNVKAAAKKKETIKQRFETGDVYKNNANEDDDADISQGKQRQEDESKGQISNKVSERMQMLARQHAQDQLIKGHLKVKNIEGADIMNQFEFFENYNPDDYKRNEFRTENLMQQNNSAHDENDETSDIKIDGIKIDGVVDKAKNNYLHTLKKSENIQKKQPLQNALNTNNQSKMLNGKKVESAKNQPIRTEPPQNNVDDEYESEPEGEISSKRPPYLDSDLKYAKQAARTRDLKERFEQWNYDNNVYQPDVYNDSIPEYEEIDDSQTETAKSTDRLHTQNYLGTQMCATINVLFLKLLKLLHFTLTQNTKNYENVRVTKRIFKAWEP